QSLSNRMAAQIYNVIDGYLWACEPPTIPAEIVQEIRGAVSPLLLDMASYEIALFMRKFTRNSMFESARTRRHIEERFHGRFEITVVGKTPTIYSPKQAPQSWFLLRLLELFGSGQFEYEVQTESASRARSSRGDPTAGRIVVRQGPDYGPLTALANPIAHGWARIIIDDPVYWWSWMSNEDSSFEQELCSYFRKKRWRQMVGLPALFDDANADDKR